MATNRYLCQLIQASLAGKLEWVGPSTILESIT